MSNLQHQFARFASVDSIIFKNTSPANPLVNVTNISYFKEDGVTGIFTKKEYRYSFNNIDFSNWNSLSIFALQSIQLSGNSNLYLEIRYSRVGVNSGNINFLYLMYSSSEPAVDPITDASIDADYFQGKLPEYYLNLGYRYITLEDVSNNYWHNDTSIYFYNLADADVSSNIPNGATWIYDASTQLWGAALSSSSGGVDYEWFTIGLSNEASNLKAETVLTDFRFPETVTISNILMYTNTAPTGSAIIVDMLKNGVSIFSTKITIDASTTSSATAAVPYVLTTNPTTFTANTDILSVVNEQVGSIATGATGKIQFKATRT